MIGARAEGPELMDRPGAVDPAALRRALDDLGTVNRWLGGYRPLRGSLAKLVSARKAVTVLDVGAGDAATLLHLRSWAPPSWRFVGIDLHPEIARLARARAAGADRVRIARSDALRMPFGDDAVDVALCNLTLHHFGEEDAVALLREMARVATLGVLVNDLHRHVLNYLAALFLAGTLWLTSPVTRHDGPLSVRRSFTPDELARLGDAAGLEDVRVRRHLPFRLLLEARPPGNVDRGRPSGASARAARPRSDPPDPRRARR